MIVRVEFDQQNRPITYVDGERVRAKGDVLDGRVVHATVDGVPVSFCARPETAELAEALAEFKAEREASLRAAIAQHSNP